MKLLLKRVTLQKYLKMVIPKDIKMQKNGRKKDTKKDMMMDIKMVCLNIL